MMLLTSLKYSESIFRVTIGILIILSVILLTASVIKLLPAFVKVIGVLANVFTIYMVLDWLKRKSKKEVK